MDAATNVRIGSDLDCDAVIQASKKLNNVLSNIQNSVAQKNRGEFSLEMCKAEQNARRDERKPFVTRSKREVFQFSEDEDTDTQPFKSSACNSNIRKNSFEYAVGNYRSRRPASESVDLCDAEDDHCVADLATQLSTIGIDGSDVDDYHTADSEPENVNDDKKCIGRIKRDDSRKNPKGVKSRPQKENIDVTKRTVKSAKSKVKKTKRKDSFIVSDDSSISDDADDVTIYHQILTKSIRSDVRKMTPKPRSRKKVPAIPTYDDRMFSAYIITKRSGSEYSSSEDESTEDPSPMSSQFTNESCEKSVDESSGVQSENVSSGSSSSSSSSSSDGSVITPEPNKKDDTRMTPPPSAKKNGFRKFSWLSSDDDSSSSDEAQSEAGSKSLSFLKSLSNPEGSRALHPDAGKYIKNFKKLKEELASRLFTMYNVEIFKNQLPSDLKLEWNARLTSCAGKCYNGRNKSVIGPNNECLRTSRIVLSTKILESPDRLRDTLIHEMCHAATWIIDRQCGGHGPLWKAWAAKAVKTFPELPLIERCHNYSIKTKYKYRCVRCGYTIGRHSKSLRTDTQLCGYCHGVFELVVEKPTSSKSNAMPKFASFVQENYGKIKSQKPDLKHKDIMKELSENFASTKISN